MTVLKKKRSISRELKCVIHSTIDTKENGEICHAKHATSTNENIPVQETFFFRSVNAVKNSTFKGGADGQEIKHALTLSACGPNIFFLF